MRCSIILLLVAAGAASCATAEDEIGARTGGAPGVGGGAPGGADSGGTAPVGGTATGSTTATGGLGTGGGLSGTGGGLVGSCNDDDQKNGLETGVDCGSLCGVGKKCPVGEGCRAAADCVSNICTDSVCSHCGDGELNGDETEVDCGGACGGCSGDTCSDTAPCATAFVCGGGTCTHCGNRVLDGDETGKDCGGSCLLCTGATCGAGTECASGDCTGDVCQAASCVEGWETKTKESEGTGDYLCADVQPGGVYFQGDRAGCADILDCLITNADTCATYADCVSSDSSGTKTCDVISDMPARQYAQNTWNQLCN